MKQHILLDKAILLVVLSIFYGQTFAQSPNSLDRKVKRSVNSGLRSSYIGGFNWSFPKKGRKANCYILKLPSKHSVARILAYFERSYSYVVIGRYISTSTYAGDHIIAFVAANSPDAVSELSKNRKVEIDKAFEPKGMFSYCPQLDMKALLSKFPNEKTYLDSKYWRQVQKECYTYESYLKYFPSGHNASVARSAIKSNKKGSISSYFGGVAKGVKKNAEMAKRQKERSRNSGSNPSVQLTYEVSEIWENAGYSKSKTVVIFCGGTYSRTESIYMSENGKIYLDGGIHGREYFSSFDEALDNLILSPRVSCD